MPKDIMLDAIEQDMRHYPDVKLEVEEKAKHRRAHLIFGEKTAWVGISRTPDRTAPQKAVAEIRRVLRVMGAARIDRLGTKKEVEAMARATDLKVAVTGKSIKVTIPTGNPHYSKFLDSGSGLGKGRWKLELQANPDLNGEPFIHVVDVPIPPGKKVVPGAHAPTKLASKDLVITFPAGTHKNVYKRFGMFGATPVKIRNISEHAMTLILPPKEQRKEVLLRGEDRHLEKITRPAPKEQTKPPEKVKAPEQAKPPEKEAPHAPEAMRIPVEEEVLTHGHLDLNKLAEIMAANRGPGIEALAALLHQQEPVKFPDKMQLVLPSSGSGLTVERCIDFLNKKKKDKANNLTFTIREGGYLSYIEKGGYN